MYRVLFSLLFLSLISLLSAQEYSAPDTVYLRNGKVVCGELQSGRNDDFIKMSVNGKLQLFSSTDIKRIGSSLNEEFKDFSWGLKLGTTLAGVSGSDARDTDSNPGFTAGVFTNYRLNRNFSLQVELFYTPKGYAFKREQNYAYIYHGNIYQVPGRYEAEFDFAAIELPLLLKWSLPESRNIQTFVLGGPVVSYVSSSALKQTFDYYYGSGSVETDVDKSFNKIQYGAILGSELLFRFGRYDLLFDIRYQRSFTTVYSDLPVQPETAADQVKELAELPPVYTEKPKIYNTNMTVMLGFVF